MKAVAISTFKARLWEIALLVEAGRVRLALPLDEGLARATAAPRVGVHPITPAIANEVAALGSTRGWDPADRIIVATARALGGPPRHVRHLHHRFEARTHDLVKEHRFAR